ncbi:hypothetical protein [Zobellella endophytica]|uniref:hypothetical protein n=1 Tax=Zobellella endophytica TaxID=2116700 RepID=UPI0011B25072|nr:hypothetical protein [Zobellella endophytica]
MTQPQDGELLQSYIFRTLSMMGESDFRLLFFNGRWRCHRIIDNDHYRFYEGLGFRHLIRLYDELFCVGEKFDFVSDRFGWSIAGVELFFSKKKEDRGGPFYNIKYCKECINRQISEVGFSCFKSSWYNSSKCDIHGCEINELPVGLNLRKTLKCVRHILSADWSSLASIECFSGESEVGSLLYSSPSMSFSLSPCAKRELASYFFRSQAYYPDGFNSPVTYGALSKSDSDTLTSFSQRAYILKNLNLVFSNKYYSSDFPDRYMAENFTALEFNFFGVFHELMKSKVRDCSSCVQENMFDYIGCPLNVHVKAVHKYKVKRDNMCDDYVNSLEAKVHFAYERLGVLKGENFVYRSIDNVKNIEEIYGSISNYKLIMKGKLISAARSIKTGG